jgi:hypothetical protein
MLVKRLGDHKAEIGSLQGQAPVERTDCPPNKRTSRCHVQYQDPEQVKKRESPYWLHTPSQKDVVEAKKICVPYPTDHVYESLTAPEPSSKITSCARRPQVERDNMFGIMAVTPNVREYSLTSPRPHREYFLQTPYGSERASDPHFGPNTRSLDYHLAPHASAASPPGKKQRTRGTMAREATVKSVMGWDLD